MLEGKRSAVRHVLALLRGLASRVLPPGERDRLETWIIDWKVRRSSDQRHMRRVLVPALARRGGQLLFVGCRRYTADYPRVLERGGATCWTIDIDPEAARWGAPGRHVVAGIERGSEAFPAGSFNTIVLSGVFGFGLNSSPGQEAAIDACATLLADGGLLVLGWDTDRVDDPSALTELARSFRRPADDIGLPHRKTFNDCFHVFDVYERTRRCADARPTAEGGRAGRVGA